MQCISDGSNGLYRAGKWILNNGVSFSHILTISDSHTLIRSISSVMINSKLVRECRCGIHVLSGRFRVSHVWVPGHRHYRLAREGTLDNWSGYVTYIGWIGDKARIFPRRQRISYLQTSAMSVGLLKRRKLLSTFFVNAHLLRGADLSYLALHFLSA